MSNKYNESYSRDQSIVLKMELFFANLGQASAFVSTAGTASASAAAANEEKVHVLELSGFIDFNLIFSQVSSN